MKTFKDNAGRTWTIAVNTATVKRVRSLLGADLLAIVDKDSDVLSRLSGDAVFLVDVLYVLCKPEVEQKNLSEEDFAAGLAGDALAYATEALLEDLADFFPPEKRQLLHRALKKLKELEALVIEEAEKRLDSPQLEVELRRILGSSSGAVPASLGSTQAP